MGTVASDRVSRDVIDHRSHPLKGTLKEGGTSGAAPADGSAAGCACRGQHPGWPGVLRPDGSGRTLKRLVHPDLLGTEQCNGKNIQGYFGSG